MPPKRTAGASSGTIGAAGKFEGTFTSTKDPPYIKRRLEVWDKLYAEWQKSLEQKPQKPIEIILPDGTKKEGIAWRTTPMDIAKQISKGLASAVVVASVLYTDKVDEDVQGDVMPTSVSDSEDEDDPDEEGEGEADQKSGVMWDLQRPLEGSCKLELLKFDHPKGTETFWHSSAHLLGGALEELYGGYLCIGPPLESGFYYDIFVGDKKLGQSDFDMIQKSVQTQAKAAAPFERMVITKAQALELFKDNPFKLQLISTKVPDGAYTSAYRCNHVVDLCLGPHVPSTDRVKSFTCTKNSSAYWLGKADNDNLQRVYGISFPDEKRMKEHKKMLEEAEKRDHRNVGTQQELFFFHAIVSPGSCFWQPMGLRIYNTLVDFMRREYVWRGFQEVLTPNIYNERLFMISGHADKYKSNMYGFNIEGQDWFLKPMNCPGHCMMFDHRVRSYKELPLRMASFGVLHRNEASGTLSGLTRVRRFQQDDAHIFCREEQIKEEVIGALQFLFYVYEVFGFEFAMALSTRPKKYIGDKKVWAKAEAALKEALNASGKPWSLNPGDGAFYGPKIDVRLRDAMGRMHQCGTIQLDFQLPIRFNLQYKTEGAEEAEEGEGEGEKKAAAKAEPPKVEEPPEQTGKWVWKEGKVKTGFVRPVIIHRAILGSVERMVAILTEHYGGKWPFWLSPRQVQVIPVSQNQSNQEYAQYVCDSLVGFGFYASVDLGGQTMNNKIRKAQVAQYNYMAIVGPKDEEQLGVSLRGRESEGNMGFFTIPDLVAKFRSENKPSSQPFHTYKPYKGRMPAQEVAAAPAATGGGASEAGGPKPSAAASGGKKRSTTAALSDLKKLNEFLSTRSYIEDGPRPTAADEVQLQATPQDVSSKDHPHVVRWQNHIRHFKPAQRAAW